MDIDIDCTEEDRPKIFEYIRNRFGGRYTARVGAYGTIQEKNFVDDVCRGFNNRYKRNNPKATNEELPYPDYLVKQIKSDWDIPTDVPDGSDERSEKLKRAMKKYPEVYRYFDGLIETKISQSVHPAGMIISPVTLDDNYGMFEKDGDMCLFLDMDEAHDVSLVKYDFLVLKTVQVIRDTTRMLGKSYPKTHEIDWNDQEVWDSMLTSPAMIFQMEGQYAFDCLKRFKPKNIFDMAIVTACIRPSGASYREELLDRKRHKNPSPVIDELLKDNLGFLIFQCDSIKFLQQICGLSGSEADTIRRAIGHKDEKKLNEALPRILDGYCSKSTQPRDIAEKEAQEFLQVIKDSASYQFGLTKGLAHFS